MDKPAAHARSAVRSTATSQTESAIAEQRPRDRSHKTADEREDGNRRVRWLMRLPSCFTAKDL